MFRPRQLLSGLQQLKEKLVTLLKRNGVEVVTKGKIRKARIRRAQEVEKADMEAREANKKASPRQRARKQ